MGFGLVACIVLPAATLLDANVSPLKLSQSSVLGEVSRGILRQDNVSVLILSILVLLRVFYLLEVMLH